MSQDERTTAIGLARYAREYFDVAIIAEGAIRHKEEYKFVVPPPILFLVAHSIEIALKSYLIQSGMTLKEMKGLNHDLRNCWKEAIEKGVEKCVALNEEDLFILNMICDLYVSTELKYMRKGFKKIPAFKSLKMVAEKLLDGICPVAGYR